MQIQVTLAPDKGGITVTGSTWVPEGADPWEVIEAIGIVLGNASNRYFLENPAVVAQEEERDLGKIEEEGSSPSDGPS